MAASPFCVMMYGAPLAATSSEIYAAWLLRYEIEQLFSRACMAISLGWTEFIPIFSLQQSGHTGLQFARLNPVPFPLNA